MPLYRKCDPAVVHHFRAFTLEQLSMLMMFNVNVQSLLTQSSAFTDEVGLEVIRISQIPSKESITGENRKRCDCSIKVCQMFRSSMAA